MKFKAKITEDIISRSLLCGTNGDYNVSSSCAFAVLYNELIPNASVGNVSCNFHDRNNNYLKCVSLSREQMSCIVRFDDMRSNPLERYGLVGEEYELEIPDDVIEYWYSDTAILAQKIADSQSLVVV